MNIQYYADDGTIKNLGDDELQHWKYIKKIKTGSGWRYFYTPEELQSYYKEAKGTVNNIKKNTIDKAVLPEKIGSKYYLGNKKTRNEIRKSGAGDNIVSNTGKNKNNITQQKLDKMSDEKFEKITNKMMDNKKIRYTKKDKKITEANIREARYKRTGDINEKKKAEKARKDAESITKQYSKYEAKNVIERKKNKLKKSTNNTVNNVKKSFSKKIDKGKSSVEKKLKKKKQASSKRQNTNGWKAGKATINKQEIKYNTGK